MHQNDRLEVSRDAISRLPLVVWETDLEGRLVGSASGGGVGASEPREKCLVDVLESDGRLQDVIQGVLDGGSVAFEQQLNGSVYRVSIGPRCDGDGRIIGASGVGIDVTAERAAMDTADARDQQIRLLVDTALDAVVTCDPDSRIVVWNTGAEQLFGWSR
ncbi:MAG: PAS domain-containing protein, partial [Phycisphaeraceae bacterium]|nr:PAS domain-containing protein [Phycisphaeraceae bacterium]